TVLAASTDRTVRLWELADTLSLEHNFGVQSVAFSPDGKLALTGCKDEVGRFWDIPTGREHRTRLEHWHRAGRGEALAFSEDGKKVLAQGGGAVTLWDVATGRSTGQPIRGPVHTFAFAPTGYLPLLKHPLPRAAISLDCQALLEVDHSVARFKDESLGIQ